MLNGLYTSFTHCLIDSLLSPLRDFKNIELVVVLNNYLQAPLYKGQSVGKVIFKLDDEEISEIGLVSLEDIKSKGLFGRAWANIQLLVYRFIMKEG